jgi:hypothetical protein
VRLAINNPEQVVKGMDELIEATFELGQVFLKLELSKRGSAKLIRSLGDSESETIILQKIGKYWNQQNLLDRPDGLVVVTNHRLAFLAKTDTIFTKTDFLSFPLELIKGLETTRVMLISPAIRFQVEGKTYMFTFLANAGQVVEAIEKVTRRA